MKKEYAETIIKKALMNIGLKKEDNDFKRIYSHAIWFHDIKTSVELIDLVDELYDNVAYL